MDFKEATDKLTESGNITLTRVAAKFDITLNSISRMRRGTLSPPREWERALAELAREGAVEMAEDAKELKEFASQLEALDQEAERR